MSTTIKRLRKKLQEQIDFRLTNEVNAAERIAALQSELTTARERIALQDDEIKALKEDAKRFKNLAYQANELFNKALNEGEEARRALVLQVLATHEKPAKVPTAN